jgi:cytochrome c553
MNSRWLVAFFASAFSTIPASAETSPPKPDLSRAQGIVSQLCVACHGADGNSALPANPNLAGQHADYTLKQLMNFKPQDGKPAARPSAVMAGIVATLSGDDMRNLSAHFEAQKPKPRSARDPELVKLGQTIYRGGIAGRGVAACAACHGQDGAGVPAQFPRLAGQYAEYTGAQLKAFRAGERGNDPNRMMRALAEKLTDREIAAVAEYISGLR